MKALLCALSFLSAGMLFADAEIDVNGSLNAKPGANMPAPWGYYTHATKCKIESGVTSGKDGNRFSLKVTGKNSYLPLFYQRLIPTKPGERYKISFSVEGKAKVQLAAYISDTRSKMAQNLEGPVFNLNGKPEVLTAEFTVPEVNRNKTVPGYIRFVFNMYEGEAVITKIQAFRLDGAAEVKPLPPARTAEQRLDDPLSDTDGWRVNGGKLQVQTIDGVNAIALPYPGVSMSKIYPYDMADDAALAKMQGIQFDAKGEAGRTIYLPVAVGSYGNWSWNYTKYVPITGNEFKTYTVAWSDFIPPAGTRNMELGKPGAITCSGINAVTFGDKWEFGRANVGHEKATVYLRNLKFAKAAQAVTSCEFKGSVPLAEVVKKMKSGKPVLICCSGDSLTANGEAGKRYAELLGDILRKKYSNPKIKTEIIAVGGAHSHHLRIWAERDFTNGRAIPDLVTLTVGYNDRSAAMDAELFKASVSDYIDRVSSFCGGKTAFLLMPTMPARAERRHTQDPFADAFRSLAKERGFALFDLHAIYNGMKPAEYEAKFADKCHFNETGHTYNAEKIAEFLDQQ